MATPPQTPKLPEEVYAIFCGEIAQVTAQKVVNGLTGASAAKVKHIHALFQSAGGYVGDGVFLYNLFRAIPIELTLYNVGQISSAGVIAYLGAKRRKATARSSFMIHRSTNSPQFATAAKLQHVAQTLVLDDERTEAIFREHVNLPAELWDTLKYQDIYFTGEQAFEYGVATEIGDFGPPSGVQVYNLLA